MANNKHFISRLSCSWLYIFLIQIRSISLTPFCSYATNIVCDFRNLCFYSNYTVFNLSIIFVAYIPCYGVVLVMKFNFVPFFLFSKDNGIALLELPETYSTIRPVDFYCEAPEQVHRQISSPTVNFTNILRAAFVPISFHQKNTNLSCK